MRILGFGTYNVRSHPRVGIVLDGLAQRGHQVRQIDEPLRTGTAGRVAALRNPLAAGKFAADLLGKWGKLAASSMRYRGKNHPDAVVVGYLGHFDVILARALFPRTPIILDHLLFASNTASDRGLEGAGALGKVKNALLRGLDRAAIGAATTVLVDTPQHKELMPESQRRKGIVVPVGAPDAWFASDAAEGERTVAETNARPTTAAAAGEGGPLSVVFYGLFTPLQGTPTIARALAELEERGVDLRVTLVGTGQDEDEVRELLPAGKHVAIDWQTWVDADALPELVASHDVCLGIFGTSDKARRVVPNKAYQGIAAGCAVITSNTEPQRDTLGDAAIFVEPGDATALADAIESLADSAVLAAARERSRAARNFFRPIEVVAELNGAL